MPLILLALVLNFVGIIIAVAAKSLVPAALTFVAALAAVWASESAHPSSKVK